eukprot:scaffold189213_cov15-Tisochrysis_lutea.AAC.1
MRRTSSAQSITSASRPRLILLVITLFFCGYFLGLSTKHLLVPGLPEPEDEVVQGTAVGKGKAVVVVDEFKAPDPNDPFRKFRGMEFSTRHAALLSCCANLLCNECTHTAPRGYHSCAAHKQWGGLPELPDAHHVSGLVEDVAGGCTCFRQTRCFPCMASAYM